MRPQLEMDTCLRRYLRNGGIRLIASHPIFTSCPHGSRIRCRSGCGVRDRMGFAGGVRSRTALGRSGQGELAKASWESASSGRTGVRPPRMRLSCEKHGGIVRAVPVTKTRDLGPFRGVRRNSCPARRAVTLHSVAIYKSSGGAPRRPPRRRLRQTELDYRIPGW